MNRCDREKSIRGEKEIQKLIVGKKLVELKKYQKRRRNEKMEGKIMKCKICGERVVCMDIMLDPEKECNHLSVCMNCYEDIKNGNWGTAKLDPDGSLA
ncbi:MAG: hypothetical protein L6408_09770 [Nanoarchaeota archaeon]|nr:hypothetical protein [Nanoarchaeota archaeon]